MVNTVTRQSELNRLLVQLAAQLPRPHWVALVDRDGLMVACVPPTPSVEPERIAAMTAVGVAMGERVAAEVAGGGMRYVNVAGAERQMLIIILGKDRSLSIGLDMEVRPQDTFESLARNVAEIARVLNRRYSID